MARYTQFSIYINYKNKNQLFSGIFLNIQFIIQCFTYSFYTFHSKKITSRKKFMENIYNYRLDFYKRSMGLKEFGF